MSRTQALTKTATIPNGTALSGAIATGGLLPVFVGTPAAWTAAAITMQASFDGTTWRDVWTASAEMSLTTDVNRLIQIPVTIRAAFVRIRSGPASAPVNQGADRTMTLVLSDN